MMKCTLCFESAVGVRPDDYFVTTRNGHVFHYCCVMEFIASGCSICPICDEDLKIYALARVNSQGMLAPPRPPKPGNSNARYPPTPTPTANKVSQWSDPWNLYGTQTQSLQTPYPAQASAGYCVQPDYVFKIVVLGDFNVGKSSLLQRFADDRFDPIIPATAGCDLRVKVIQIAGKIVRLNLWDTAGQERHRAVVDMYLRKADGIIFCFDLTDLASFHSLESWFQFSQRSLPSDTLKIIVGTKSDLWPQCVVHTHQVQNLAMGWNAQYIYTSAKDAVNVEIVFRTLSALILENRLPSSFNNTSTIPCAPPLELGHNQNGTVTLHSSSKTKKGKKKTSGKRVDSLDKCCK